MTQPPFNVVNSEIVSAALQGPPGANAPGDVVTPWIDLLVDGSQVLWTLSPVLAEKEESTVLARVEFEQIGASNVGGTISRIAQVQLVSGVPTSVFTGQTSAFDFDITVPTPPANFSTAVAGCLATIDRSGSDMVVHVSRPAGVAVRARATIGVTRLTRPVGPYALSANPSSGPTTGATEVVIAGEGLSTVTSVSIGSVVATIQGTADYSVTVSTGVASSAGTVDIVVTRADGTTATLHNGWTYTTGLVATIVSISPAFDRLEGGRTGVLITGTNFSGATSVHIGGSVATVTGNTGTVITVTVPAGITAGAADVVVTSSANNPSTGGAGKFFFLPSGLISVFESSQATASTSVLATWPDIVAGSGWSLIKNSSPPVNTNEVNGIQSVVSKSGVGYFVFNNATHFVLPTMSSLLIGTRPVSPSPNSDLISLYDSTVVTAGQAQAGAATMLDSGPATGSIEWRNNVSATSTIAPSVNTSVFAASQRCDGVTGVTARLNGSDLATVAQTGVFAINEMAPGQGWGAGGGRFSGVPEVELHVLLVAFANRAWTGTDFTVWTQFMTFYYGLSLPV